MIRKLFTLLTAVMTSATTWAQSTSDIGKVLAADGKMYKTVAAATNAGTTASGIIAYWGAAGSVESGNSSYRGMAIAIEDAVLRWGSWPDHTNYCSSDSHQCSTATSYCSTVSSALNAINGIAATTSAQERNGSGHWHNAPLNGYDVTRPSGSSIWAIPSVGQWKLMAQGLTGKSSNLSETDNPDYTYDKLSAKITAAGGNTLRWLFYWSSTEVSASNAYIFDIGGINSNRNGSRVRSYAKNTDNEYTHVRMFFAFSSATAAVYTISYNANGGSGAPSNQTKDGGIDLTLSSTVPTRTGYAFAGWNTQADGSGTSYASGATFTGNTNTTLYAQWTFQGSGIENDPYLIPSEDVWNYLADQVAAGNTYSGKYFQLTEDIGTAQNPITTMVGIFSDTESDKRPFSGTFDGYGHTITVNYHETRTALFSYVKVATIRNLIVAGNCGTAGRAASIVGESDESDGLNTVTNCVSSVTISGSLVGGIALGGNVDIRGCLFNGTINGTSQSGGIVCWGKNITKITNCVFAPQAGSSISGGTFCYTGEVGATVTNCYYTTALGTAQGKQARSISAGDDVTISNLGAATATYNVSGIIAYSHGIKYNDIYYAGDGDAVSLNLSHADKAGYTFNQYTVSGGGSLSNIDATSATLTMSAANQTIDAQWTENVATLNEMANALDELTAMSGKQTKVTFTRSGLTANSYSTMCLPFDFTAPSGCTFYAFTGVEWSTTNDQWEATITEQASATTLSAHTPYIFKCTGTSATFTNNAVIAASSYDNALVEVGATSGTDQAWKFKGTYTPLSCASADPTEPTYGFSTYVPNETIAAGTFVRFVKGASLAPFRARLIYSGTDTHLNAPRRAGANELPVIIIVRIIGINGETTSIGTLDTRTGEVTTDGWYTLGGMKLKGQPNQQGIYIHNGRKEVIR